MPLNQRTRPSAKIASTRHIRSCERFAISNTSPVRVPTTVGSMLRRKRIVGSICDSLHYEFTQFIRPGLTENEVAAFGFEYLYNIPGMEDVEDT